MKKILLFSFLIFSFITGISCNGLAQTDIYEQFENSMKYYEKAKAKGAEPNDLMVILDRIKSKYDPYGVDLSIVEKEYNKLQALRQKPLKSPAVKVEKPEAKPKVEFVKLTDLKDYKIEVGDLLSIIVYPAEELSREVIVQPDGRITMPMIGEVLASGETKEKLGKELVNKLKIYVSKPEVSIAVKRYSKKKVFLTGEVTRPGDHDYKDEIRLLESISQAGGFTDKANLRDIRVYRGEGQDRKVFELNLEDVFKSGDFTKDFTLFPGDVVEVGKIEKDVYVIGEVENPGSYKHKKGLKILEVITLASGFTDEAVTQRVKVYRGKAPNMEVYEVNMNKVLDKNQFDLDIELEPGDTVYVPKKGFAKSTWFMQQLVPWLTFVNFILLIIVASN
ncbi:MAG: polysaccharide biosynthesis/export family protein [bacterium]